MKKYILKRILISALTLLLILFLLFLLLEFMPGSPFNDEKLNEMQKALLYQKYGLDQPVYYRFYLYVKNIILHGDFGVSYTILKDIAVSTIIKDRIMITIRIGLQALMLGTFLGVLLGLVAAIKKNSIVDTFTTILAVIGVSIPSYVFAILLIYFLAYKLKFFPITFNLKDVFRSTILPTISLSVFVMAQTARFLRMEMIEVLKSDYIELAESKGIKPYKVIIKHGLRNALIPVITILGPLTVSLMTGSLVVEKVFGIPGIGGLLVTGIQVNDFNVVIAIAFIYSALFIFVNLIVDILYGVIDPRIRISKEVNHA